MQQLLNFFYSYGASPREVEAMVSRCPMLALYSLHHMGEVMLYLKSHGLSDRDVIVVARSVPHVFTRSVADLQQLVAFLAGHGLLPHLRQYAYQGPGLLCADVADLAPILRLLKDRLALSDARCSRLLQAMPALLLYGANGRLKRNLDFLAGAGFDGAMLRLLATRLPGLLVDEEKALQRKWLYLVSHIGLTAAQVLAAPALLSAPLKQVTGPRYDFLRSTGRLPLLRLGEVTEAEAAAQPVAEAPTPTTHSDHLGEAEAATPSAYPTAYSHADCSGGLTLTDLACAEVHSFCELAHCSVAEYQEYKVKWWRSEGLKWGGINMQLPEDTSGWTAFTTRPD